jgi:hypothetical protein
LEEDDGGVYKSVGKLRLAFLPMVWTNFDLIDFPTCLKSESSLDFFSLSVVDSVQVTQLPRSCLKASIGLGRDKLCMHYLAPGSLHMAIT